MLRVALEGGGGGHKKKHKREKDNRDKRKIHDPKDYIYPSHKGKCSRKLEIVLKV